MNHKSGNGVELEGVVEDFDEHEDEFDDEQDDEHEDEFDDEQDDEHEDEFDDEQDDEHAEANVDLGRTSVPPRSTSSESVSFPLSDVFSGLRDRIGLRGIIAVGVGVIVVLIVAFVLIASLFSGSPTQATDGETGTPETGVTLTPSGDGAVMLPTAIPSLTDFQPTLIPPADNGSQGQAQPQTTFANSGCPQGYLSHTVQPGQNLFRIGLLYGIVEPGGVTLARMNGISDPNQIREGQQLCVPSGNATSVFVQPPLPASCTRQYVVQRGDGLFAIAQTFGLLDRFSEFAQINGVTDINRISVDQIVCVSW